MAHPQAWEQHSAVAREAPHECDIAGCPGPINKDKLDAFPELLEACQEVVKVIKDGDIVLRGDPVFRKVQAAIVKATSP